MSTVTTGGKTWKLETDGFKPSEFSMFSSDEISDPVFTWPICLLKFLDALRGGSGYL